MLSHNIFYVFCSKIYDLFVLGKICGDNSRKIWLLTYLCFVKNLKNTKSKSMKIFVYVRHVSFSLIFQSTWQELHLNYNVVER